MARTAALVAMVAMSAMIRAEAGEPRPQLTITYTAPKRADVVGAPKDHIEWMTTVIARLDRELRLPRDIAVKYQDCDAANAYYYPDDHTITICHQLWDERRKLYVATDHDDETIDPLLRNAMTFTFVHEFGHALHRELGFPIIGRSEDAVDAMATMMLIAMGPRGRDAARHAAYGHALRSRQPKHEHDFWDEHGSGAQRGFSIACLLHGADKEHVADLMKELKVPAARLAKCTRDYPVRVSAWKMLVGPHLATPDSWLVADLTAR